MTNSSYTDLYTLYAKAYDNTPDDQMVADQEKWPGGRMCGFILWMNAAWRKFDELHDPQRKDVPHTPKERDAFREWLKTEYKNVAGWMATAPATTEQPDPDIPF